MRTRWGLLVGAMALLASLLVDCERLQPVEEIREWTPNDHHSRDDDRARPQGSTSAATADPADSTDRNRQLAQLIEFAWRQQCSQCHGPTGKGDGPSGPMVETPDLTREQWQAAVSDSEIVSIIRSGRGKMPRFDLLPDVVLRGIVSRIRSMRAR